MSHCDFDSLLRVLPFPCFSVFHGSFVFAERPATGSGSRGFDEARQAAGGGPRLERVMER